MRALIGLMAALSAAAVLTACNGPVGSPSLSNTAPNAVRATAKAEFLYAPAGSDKIRAFAIDRATGAVGEVATSPYSCAAGRGKYPVGNIAVDPAARFLYCSSTKTDKIVGYTIDAATGALTRIAGSPFTDPNGAPTVLASLRMRRTCTSNMRRIKAKPMKSRGIRSTPLPARSLC